MAPGREIASFECSLCRDDFGELEHSMGPNLSVSGRSGQNA